jgi:hypothetical protein
MARRPASCSRTPRGQKPTAPSFVEESEGRFARSALVPLRQCEKAGLNEWVYFFRDLTGFDGLRVKPLLDVCWFQLSGF